MSLDSNQNAGDLTQSQSLSTQTASGWLVRFITAILLSFGIAAFVGATAWSAPQARSYSQSELNSVQTSNENKISELRNQEITQLRIALGRRTPANRRADLYLRLAEIYIEAYRANYLLEGRVHEKRLEAGKTEANIDHSHSRPLLLSGIQACNDIIRLKIPYGKMDHVYYFLGFSNGELGNHKESIRNFEALTRNYPASPLTGEAYRELGDHAFDNGNYRKAQTYYASAVKLDRGDNLPRTLHKLAWSFYRTKQYSRAVDTLKEAISAASRNNERFLSLREEALRDMAIFMTETGRVEEALTYFQNVAGDKDFYPRVLEKLGRQYERNVEPQKAIQVYQALLKTRPDDEAAFRARAKLVDLDLRRGKYKEALGRIRGARLFTSGEPETQTAAQNLRAMIRRTATEQHELFRKKGVRSSLSVAEEFYLAYLDLFLAKDDPRSEKPEIQMYLADVKRELGKSKEASEIYRNVLDSKDKRYAKEAGALWTASLAEAIKTAPKTAPTPPTKLEPSDLEKEFVEAADDMENALGDMPEAREAALKAAQVLAGYPSTQKEALKRSRSIAARWPKTIQGINGARLWLQILSDRLPAGTVVAQDSGAVSDLKESMKEIRENSVLMAGDNEVGGGKLKTFLAEIETRLKVGAIASQERDKDYGAAAKGYEAFAAESSKRDLAEKAYANAITSYLKIQDYLSVDRVSSSWSKRFPGSKVAADSMRSAATSAMIRGLFDVAAGLFEKMGKDDSEALLMAASLHEGNGNVSKAQLIWSRFFTAFPKSEKRWSVALVLAQSFEAEMKDGEAGKTYKYCLAGPADFAAECGARLADLYLRLQNVEESKALFKKVAAQKKSGSPYVGYARYRLAELMEREASFAPLQLPEEKLKKGLTQRLEFVEPLSRATMSAVEAGGPWAVAALDRLALWAMNFADEIDAIAPPQKVDAAATAQFRKNLMTVSEPLRKKAIETWKNASEKAVAAELYSPALPALLDRLADARVAGGLRAQGFRDHLRVAGLASDGGAEGREAALERVRDRLLKNGQDSAAWVDYGNLLWGKDKPLLAKIAYDRALVLDRKNVAALNNRGVVIASGSAEEDGLRAGEAAALFSEALKVDEFFVTAKINRALLLNYYRIFSKAKPIWEQVIARMGTAFADPSQIYDGLGIAQQGLGDLPAAKTAFEKASQMGAASNRFASVYHEAARSFVSNSQDGIEECLDLLNDLKSEATVGFERDAAERLKRTCGLWKTGK